MGEEVARKTEPEWVRWSDVNWPHGLQHLGNSAVLGTIP